MRGEAASGDGGPAPDRPQDDYRVPVVSLVLMAVFLVGGSVGLVVDWPVGPGNLDWGVWTVVYGGYLYVIAAALFHARTGR